MHQILKIQRKMQIFNLIYYNMKIIIIIFLIFFIYRTTENFSSIGRSTKCFDCERIAPKFHGNKIKCFDCMKKKNKRCCKKRCCRKRCCKKRCYKRISIMDERNLIPMNRIRLRQVPYNKDIFYYSFQNRSIYSYSLNESIYYIFYNKKTFDN